MKICSIKAYKRHPSLSAITLIEVVLSLAIMGISFGAIILAACRT